jgi:hypothetical protein
MVDKEVYICVNFVNGEIMHDKAQGELVVEHVVGSLAAVGFCRVEPEAEFEGLEYLSSLHSSDQKKFEARFVRLAERGSLVNTEHFNYEGSGIWFIKIDGHRLACFKHAGKWLMITSGAKKDPKDRTRRLVVERAIRIRDQFLFALAADRARTESDVD